MTAATANKPKRALQGDAVAIPPDGVEEFESPRVHQAEKPEQQGADNPPGNEASTVGCGGQRGGVGLPPTPPVRSVSITGSAMTEDISALAAALAAAQAEMRSAVKDAANPHFKSRYADLASVWEAWRLAGPRHGLAVVQLVEADGSSVTVTSTLAHSSGQWMRGTLRLPVSKADAQGVGSAITYGRRYALAALVGVAPDDDDGESAVGRGGHASNGNGSNGNGKRQVAAPNHPAARGQDLKRIVWDLACQVCGVVKSYGQDGSAVFDQDATKAAAEALLFEAGLSLGGDLAACRKFLEAKMLEANDED